MSRQPLWNMVLKSMTLDVPNDPAITLLEIYSKKMKSAYQSYLHPNVYGSLIHNK